jgi:hypothetical protein
MLTVGECTVGPSVAVTVTVYGFCGKVAGFNVTIALPLADPACEVAVTVTDEGRPAAIIGAV